MDGTYSRRNHLTCRGGEEGAPYCRCCCNGCLYNCFVHDPDHGNCLKPKRVWYSGGGWTSPWWQLLILVGIRGGDEFCNRTIGLKVPGGAVFLNLNFPMRTETCDKCLDDTRPSLPPLQ